MNRLHRHRRSAFTLVELILVITILGILASVVAANYAHSTDRARIRAAETQIKALQAALGTFDVHVGRFPTSDEGLQALVENPDGNQDWAGPYLMSRAIPEDPWHHAYVYDPAGVRGVGYDLFSPGPDGSAGTEDDIGNWPPEVAQR